MTNTPLSTFSRTIAVVTLLSLVALQWSVLCAQADATRIAILTSQEEDPYKDVVKGFQSFLAQQGVAAAIDEYPLHGDILRAKQAVHEGQQRGVRLFFAVGTLATQAVLSEVKEVPVVAALTANAEVLQKAGNATGVTIDFPEATQLAWMQKFLPEQKNIGVLFNPQKNASKVATLTQTVQEFGIRMVTQEVTTAKEVADAFSSLATDVTVLWGIADQTVFSPETTEDILLFSFRNRIPLIGPSPLWVKAGALYALDRDYRDIGLQCGEIAQKILQGTKISTLPPTTPRKVSYTLNLKTAHHMKLSIAQSLIDGAQQVFK